MTGHGGYGARSGSLTPLMEGTPRHEASESRSESRGWERQGAVGRKRKEEQNAVVESGLAVEESRKRLLVAEDLLVTVTV